MSPFFTHGDFGRTGLKGNGIIGFECNGFRFYRIIFSNRLSVGAFTVSLKLPSVLMVILPVTVSVWVPPTSITTLPLMDSVWFATDSNGFIGAYGFV